MSHDPLRRWAETAVAEGWFPGAAWSVMADGRVLSSGAVGDAALEPERRPAEPDLLYDLASLTKPLCTALLAVLLEARGVLDLEAAVGEYLPEIADRPAGRRRLVELGVHVAGLPPWHPLYLEGRGLDAYVSAIGALSEDSAPRTPVYSDLGFILLGAVVERVVGEPLDALFASWVAAPLGLDTLRFNPPTEWKPRIAPTERGNAYERAMVGRAGKGFPWRTELIHGEVHDGNAWALGGVAGHAGLFGAAEEVARLAGALMEDGPLELGGPARRRLLEASPLTPFRTFGFDLARSSRAARGILPDDAPGHTGFTGTSVWLDPGRKRVYVLLSNRVHPRVPNADFQPVRRGFHRCACSL